MEIKSLVSVRSNGVPVLNLKIKKMKDTLRNELEKQMAQSGIKPALADLLEFLSNYESLDELKPIRYRVKTDMHAMRKTIFDLEYRMKELLEHAEDWEDHLNT